MTNFLKLSFPLLPPHFILDENKARMEDAIEIIFKMIDIHIKSPDVCKISCDTLINILTNGNIHPNKSIQQIRIM